MSNNKEKTIEKTDDIVISKQELESVEITEDEIFSMIKNSDDEKMKQDFLKS